MASCPVDHSALASAKDDGKTNTAAATLPSGADKCPVDHQTRSSWAGLTSWFSSSASASSPPSSSSSSSSSSVDQVAAPDKCPVDHQTRSAWGGILPSSSGSGSGPSSSPSTPQLDLSTQLPIDREVSSIPRLDGSNWVYPSEAQFFNAMARKNHSPQSRDMRVIVPIHNAVNERAWGEVLRWEAGRGGEGCGGVRLVSFKGRPKDRTPKAWMRTLVGYQPPFDRHDWVVDRCGTRIRYVIDFYSGKANGPAGNLAFYLDARPALDDWESVKMRMEGFLQRWVGPLPWLAEKGKSAS